MCGALASKLTEASSASVSSKLTSADTKPDQQQAAPYTRGSNESVRYTFSRSRIAVLIKIAFLDALYPQ